MGAFEEYSQQWAEILPDADSTSFLSIGRMIRIVSYVTIHTEEVASEHGLNRGEFELLGAMRRSGEDIRATELSVLTKSSGAAITKRLDRLSNAGLLTRTTLPSDRRVVLVNLTPAGKELIEELVPLVLDAEREMLNGLSESEILQLRELTAKILKNYED